MDSDNNTHNYNYYAYVRACTHTHTHTHTAMKPQEVQESLHMTKLRDRQWYVQPSCATSGDGLYEGLTWLTSNHKNKK